MKISILPLLLAVSLPGMLKADDIVIFRRSVALSGVENAESTAPTVTGLRAVTGKVTEVQYEVIDLTNNQHNIIEVYAVDPLTGGKGYVNTGVASGLGYSVIAGYPAGTQSWFNGRVFSEETAGVQTSTLHEIYEEFGKAAPTKIGTKTLVVPARITIVRSGIDQFQNSESNVRGSQTLAGAGTSTLDKKLSGALAPDGDLAAAVQSVITLLESQKHVNLEP